jgi:hypothetical protein
VRLSTTGRITLLWTVLFAIGLSAFALAASAIVEHEGREALDSDLATRAQEALNAVRRRQSVSLVGDSGVVVLRGTQAVIALGPLDDFASGTTLLFADACADFGILKLLRTTELGPFTSSEIRMLTFALNALSDRLSGLGLQPAPQHIAAQLGVNPPNVHVASRHSGLKSKAVLSTGAAKWRLVRGGSSSSVTAAT